MNSKSNHNPELPNQWNVLIGYQKTMITISSALLTFSVVFVDKLIQPEYEGLWHKYTLLSSWILFFITVIASILSMAYTTNYLRNGTKEKCAIFCANFAFFALALGSFLLVVTGYMSLFSSCSSTSSLH